MVFMERAVTQPIHGNLLMKAKVLYIGEAAGLIGNVTTSHNLTAKNALVW